MKKTTRDSQRSACYAWEKKVGEDFPEAKRIMTLDECKALVERVWDDYHPGKKPPHVKDGRGTRKARGSRWEINLPQWARYPLIVLHEVAHSLQEIQPWHGLEFARLVMDLWCHYLDLPKVQVRLLGTTQKPRRVRFASLAASVRKPRQEWLKWKKRTDELNRLFREHQNQEPKKY